MGNIKNYISIFKVVIYMYRIKEDTHLSVYLRIGGLKEG